MHEPADFLSCDWGTSHFRLRLVDAQSLEIRDEIRTTQGAAALAAQTPPNLRATGFSGVLAGHIGTLLGRTPSDAESCVVSGMASSNIGWFELPYAVAPLPLRAERLERRTIPLSAGGREILVNLVSGISTGDDVMRGEECELLGLLEGGAGSGGGRKCILLPGTHSKHAYLNDRTLEGFTTFMTGELFAGLGQLGTLQSPLADGGGNLAEPFAEGVCTALHAGLAAGLFKIRARSVLSPATADGPSFLSGLLIGSELASLPDGIPCLLAATTELRSLYLQADEIVGRGIAALPPEDLRDALVRAHRSLLPE